MKNWFTVEHVDADTHIISEYRHWEESHAYLLNGTESSLLIDTGLGICSIYEEVKKWTDKPVAAVATHVHWDHVGGHRYFPQFYAHEAELPWLSGAFPLTLEQIKGFVTERCDLPDDFCIDDYVFFQGTPTRVLRDNDRIDLGGRELQVLHTPGHSPGHMCFWEADRGYLFTGDLVYLGTLLAYYPSTDPKAYLDSMERISALPVKKVLPAHHSLDIQPSIIQEITAAFQDLNAAGKLRHGGGVFSYGDFAIWI